MQNLVDIDAMPKPPAGLLQISTGRPLLFAVRAHGLWMGLRPDVGSQGLVVGLSDEQVIQLVFGDTSGPARTSPWAAPLPPRRRAIVKSCVQRV